MERERQAQWNETVARLGYEEAYRQAMAENLPPEECQYAIDEIPLMVESAAVVEVP